ncbi:uncharacterized protein LOC106053027 isoform X3 [Biomphalaria glabrata]|nr:uncharacterized protein LOC106053027 isoform X3 [Biomphalaria glabrata]XP_055883002.1 uncharacterized protein LOC106053027 isoform X3 [Biomphalaria glabrata]XP_055883003.1 uncharacterized protein LOC106053027 isoform X3 [Biomphalaria glabrata]XP_055883004.1 uncharacterized protein LOC106053027 isoform X3 [Biomphalaria glabrata]
MVKAWLCVALICMHCTLTYSQCWYNGFYYQFGPFQPEPCLSCFCFDSGATDCFIIQCPTCLFYYYKPGDCCATCEPPPNPTQSAAVSTRKAACKDQYEPVEVELLGARGAERGIITSGVADVAQFLAAVEDCSTTNTFYLFLPSINQLWVACSYQTDYLTQCIPI